mgnify:CR=1 FL=1
MSNYSFRFFLLLLLVASATFAQGGDLLIQQYSKGPSLGQSYSKWSLYAGTEINRINTDLSTTSPTITNNIPSEIFNYSFLGSWFSCSDINLLFCNVSIDGFNKASGANFTLTHNGNLSYTITAIDLAGNQVTDDGYLYVNPKQYFRFSDIFSSSYLSNYTFGGYSSIGNYVSFNALDVGLGTFTYQFNKFGYNRENFTFNINSTSNYNITYNVSKKRYLKVILLVILSKKQAYTVKQQS